MNIEAENRNGYHISAEMKSVWAVEMQLLTKTLEVCEKHQLKIWAEGGTLLGAVREHGFIPWDDDIDMAMPRKDFDKLQSIAKEEFKAPFFYQSGYTDLLPNGVVKLRMDNTAAIERVSVFCNHHQGIFIDIFPLDVMPDNEKESKLFINNVVKKRKELSTFCYHNYSLSDWKYNYRIYKKIKTIKRKGFHNCFKEYEQYVKQYMYSDNKNVSLVAWFYKDNYLRDRQWYHDTIMLPFEDILLPIPIGYHQILTKQFGDYMTPVKAPAMHEGFICLDAGKSYLDFLPALRQKYRIESLKTRFFRFTKK